MPNKPLILGFDTSAAHVAAALVSDGRIISEHLEDRARGQDSELFPVLERLLQTADATWADICAIGVGVGPGNFTGVRISVAAAKGLGLSLAVPVVGVSMFDALRHGAGCGVYTAVPAPRGAAYIDTENSVPRLYAHPDEIENRFQLSPDDHGVERQFIGAVDHAWPAALCAQMVPPIYMCATAIALLAEQRVAAGACDPVKPLYIKSPDAAPSRNTAPVIIP